MTLEKFKEYLDGLSRTNYEMDGERLLVYWGEVYNILSVETLPDNVTFIGNKTLSILVDLNNLPPSTIFNNFTTLVFIKLETLPDNYEFNESVGTVILEKLKVLPKGILFNNERRIQLPKLDSVYQFYRGENIILLHDEMSLNSKIVKPDSRDERGDLKICIGVPFVGGELRGVEGRNFDSTSEYFIANLDDKWSVGDDEEEALYELLGDFTAFNFKQFQI